LGGISEGGTVDAVNNHVEELDSCSCKNETHSGGRYSDDGRRNPAL